MKLFRKVKFNSMKLENNSAVVEKKFAQTVLMFYVGMANHN